MYNIDREIMEYLQRNCMYLTKAKRQIASIKLVFLKESELPKQRNQKEFK